MKNHRHSFWLAVVLSLACLGTAVAVADSDYQVTPCSPAFLVLGQDLLLDEIQRRRAEKIRRLFRESGLTQEELGQAIGMDQSQLSKHLRGILPWREKWLPKLARVWNLPLMELLVGDPGPISIAGQVGADGEFPYPDPVPQDGSLGLAPALSHWQTPANGHYVLMVSERLDQALLPGLGPGALLYVEKQGGNNLGVGQLAVERHRPEAGRLALVTAVVPLEGVCLTPLTPGGQQTRHPFSYLGNLDRVCWIKL